MKKAIGMIFVAIFCLAQMGLSAQTKYYTKSGSVTFSATGPIKNLRGENKKSTFLLDAGTGSVQIGLLMGAFEFPRSIFKNVDYLESDKYPKSFYRGRITNISDVDFSKNGSYPITIEGLLTLHGITKNTPARGVVLVRDGKVSAKAKFQINLEDFNVGVPAILVNDKAVNVDVAAWFE
jgi:hypothetical protein